MNGHLEIWIEAYLDDELSSLHRHQVEAHLGECQRCRALLEERKNLSALLMALPDPANLKSEARFVAEVGLQLKQRRKALQIIPMVPDLGWYFIPVVLLLVLTFFQTVAILSNMLWVVPDAKLILLEQVSFVSVLPSLPEPLSALINMMDFLSPLNGGFFTGIGAGLLISLMYVCWLVGWWVWKQRTAVSQV